MATIQKSFELNADPTTVWEALRDFGAVHERLVPGFVTRCEIEGDIRTVTFANGSTAREHLVTIDEAARRLVYGINNERLRHYSAAAQIKTDGDKSRFVWTVDLLPDEMAPYVSDQMDLGVVAMQKAFGR